MDPFLHHPSLRGAINAPESSFFYDMTAARFVQLMLDAGLTPFDVHSDAVREGMRRALMAQAPAEEVWVFAYGSLMWDPGFHFAEVRRARIDGYARRFVLKDDVGGRGNPDAPGLMAGLAPGAHCDGLAYRIAPEAVEEETARLCRRELLGPAYLPAWHPAQTAQGPIQVMVFVADPDADGIELDLSWAAQVEYLATGEGILGTSYDYIRELVEKLRQLKIEDAEMEALLADVEQFRAAR
ncbi:MAG: gamma-glutamylcyclotransferase [Pseudomonadota bacterium]